MARQLTSKAKIVDIFKMDEKYSTPSQEINDKMVLIFRGLTSNIEDDIKALTPKERIELAIKMQPQFTKFFEAGEELKGRNEESEKARQLFAEG